MDQTFLQLLTVFFIILIIITLMGGVVWGRWIEPRLRPPETCPQCGSAKIGTVSKEPLGLRDVSGGFSSRHDVRGTIVRVRYEQKKRCNECRHAWQEIIEE